MFIILLCSVNSTRPFLNSRFEMDRRLYLMYMMSIWNIISGITYILLASVIMHCTRNRFSEGFDLSTANTIVVYISVYKTQINSVSTVHHKR